MKKLLLILAAICCVAWINAQDIATWSGFRKGVATFTFDDGAPSHIACVAPMFDRYGYKASFYLVINWNPNWEGFQALADNGHEIGSHSNSHPQNMSGEEASSKDAINDHILNHQCLTVAYPNCNVPNATAVLQNYIAGRICNGSFQSMSDYMGKDGPDNWAKVPAIITGAEGNIKTGSDFANAMRNVIQSNGWVMFMIHGLQGKPNGNAAYSPTDSAAIDGALKWAQQNDKDIWVTTMCNATMYCKERKASTFTETNRSDASISYSLLHSIADDVCAYQFPLSLRVLMPEGWTKVQVRQNGTTIPSQIDEGYIYFDAVPNGGEIIVRDASTDALDPEVSPLIGETGFRWKGGKVLKDGQLFIERDGHLFNAQGARVE